MPEEIAIIDPTKAEADFREALAPAKEAPADAGKSESQSQQTATAAKTEGEKSPESLTTDTQATADKSKPAGATDKNNETQTDAKPKSPFSANQERLEKTWKAVNQRKTELEARENAIKQQEQAVAQRENQLKLDAAKSKSKFTPEQYEEAATSRLQGADKLLLQAKGLEKQAEEHEANNEFGKAELAKQQAQDLRDQAAGEKYSAKQLKEMAQQAREAKPDPTLEQHKATLEGHKRHYLLEAAKQWPDVAKDGSEFQKTMAAHLQAAAQAGLNPDENPILFYHVARLTAAEATAARVPVLEKDLGAAQARVKELEKLTSPGGGQGATQTIAQSPEDFSKLTLDQQEAWLRANTAR